MKIFNKDGKVNFVDENNVVVGLETECVGNGEPGWYISDKTHGYFKDGDEPDENEEGHDISNYQFDVEFCVKTVDDYGGAVTFRIVNGDSELFITIWHYHEEGHYLIGFDMEHNGKSIHEELI